MAIGAGSLSESTTLFDLGDETGVAVLDNEPHREVGAPKPMVADPMGELASTYRQRAIRLKNSAPAWHQAGYAYLAARDPESARQCFEAALAIDSQSRGSRLGLARVAHEQGRSEEAVEVLRSLITERPDDLAPKISLAVVHATEGRFAEALVLLDEAVSAGDVPASLLATRGGIRFGLGDYRRAVSDLRKASRKKPDWVHVRNLLGLAELRLGRKTAAERHLREALRVGPLSLEPLVNLAGILKTDRRWGELLDLVEQFWSAGPAPIQIVHFVAEACLATDDPRRAVEWLEGASEKARNARERGIVLNNLGVAYSELGKLTDADRAFFASTEAEPSDLAIGNRAKVLLDQGDVPSAIEWLASWQGNPVFGVSARGTLALGLARAGRYDEAIAQATKLTNEEVEDVGPFLLLTYLYVDAVGDASASVNAALAGLERFPNNARLLNNLAYALLQDGRVEEAADALERIDAAAIQDRSHQTCVTATRGLLALKRGDLPTGRQLYEQAAAIATHGLREMVKAKRDLEIGRALITKGGSTHEAIALLERATRYGPSAEPFVSQARAELRLLRPGEATR